MWCYPTRSIHAYLKQNNAGFHQNGTSFNFPKWCRKKFLNVYKNVTAYIPFKPIYFIMFSPKQCCFVLKCYGVLFFLISNDTMKVQHIYKTCRCVLHLNIDLIYLLFYNQQIKLIHIFFFENFLTWTQSIIHVWPCQNIRHDTTPFRLNDHMA